MQWFLLRVKPKLLSESSASAKPQVAEQAGSPLAVWLKLAQLSASSHLQPLVIHNIFRSSENRDCQSQQQHEKHPRHRACIAHVVIFKRLAIEIQHIEKR